MQGVKFLFFPIFSYFSEHTPIFPIFLAISSYFSYFLAILLTISKYLLDIWKFLSLFKYVVSPTLLLLDLPWLTRAGIFFIQGVTTVICGIYMCNGPLVWWICFQRGLQETKAPQINKSWLRGWNSGLFRWGQVFTQEMVRVCHKQALHHWYILKRQQAHWHSHRLQNTWKTSRAHGT